MTAFPSPIAFHPGETGLLLPGSLTEGDGGTARGCIEDFLGPRVQDIDLCPRGKTTP